MAGILFPAAVWGLTLFLSSGADAVPSPGSVSAGPGPTLAAGASTDTQPIDEIPAEATGSVLPAGAAYWYHRVHVLPGTVDVGIVAGSAIERTVEVWNGHLTPQILAGISVSGVDGGVTLAIPDGSPPTTYGALESRVHTITVSPDGPPLPDARYVFDFEADAPTLRVLGQRVVVLPIPPNWSRGILERFEWATDVLTAHDGGEQRIRRRPDPRLYTEFDVLAVADDAAWLDATLDGAQAKACIFPRWPDVGPLTAAVSAGAVSLACDTSGRDFTVGGLAVLVADAATFEAFTVTSVAAGAIGIDPPVAADWPKGSRVAPARLARLRATQSAEWWAEEGLSASIGATTITGVALSASDWSPTYQGRGVFVRRPHRGEDEGHEYTRATRVVVDAPAAPDWWDDPPARGFGQHPHVHIGKDRAESLGLRAWAAARQGRFTPFWLPLWNAPMTLTGSVSSSGVTVTVKGANRGRLLRGAPWRRHIALWHRTQGWLFREVEDAAISGASDVLTLATAFGVEVLPADVRGLYWLAHVRLATDAVELLWYTTDITRLAFTASEVPE